MVCIGMFVNGIYQKTHTRRFHIDYRSCLVLLSLVLVFILSIGTSHVSLNHVHLETLRSDVLISYQSQSHRYSELRDASPWDPLKIFSSIPWDSLKKALGT